MPTQIIANGVRQALLALAFTLAVAAPAQAASESWTAPGTYDWTVPAGVTSIDVELNGARGGGGLTSTCTPGGGCSIARGIQGAPGGRTTGTVAVSAGTVVRVVVGGVGTNGGGAASGLYLTAGGATRSAGAGGGATDIRIGGTGLAQRVAVAGGGGGAPASSGAPGTYNGGAGGGLSGDVGKPATLPGGGGTQLGGGAGGGGGAAGTLGVGGDADLSTAGESSAGGGGGGGFYGGGGGGSNTSGTGGGGGGGSSLVPNGGTSVTGGATAGAGATVTYSSGVPEPTGLTVTPASPSPQNAVTVRGTAPEGSTVKLYAQDDCAGPVAATGTAAQLAAGLAVTVPSDTATTFTATATLDAGTSVCSAPVTYVEDSTPPAAPSHVSLLGATRRNQNTVTVYAGGAENGLTYRLFDTPSCSGTPRASATAESYASSAGMDVTVADDTTTTFFATATDAAGNTSACSTASLTYTEDSTAPAAPTGFALDRASPGRAMTFTVSGTAEPGATVTLYGTGETPGCPGWGDLGTTTASDTGAWSRTLQAVANSDRVVSARATDVAGNASACSGTSITYRHDEQAPYAPAITAITGSGTQTPRVSGTTTGGGSQVRLYLGDCTGTPAATGSAAAFARDGVELPSMPANVPVTVRAAAVDEDGNASGCSEPFAHLHDTIAPSVAITSPASGTILPDTAAPVIAGTAGTAERDRAQVTVTLARSGAADIVASTVSAGGAWSVRPDGPLAPGTYTVTARQRDDAGNVGAGVPVSIVVPGPTAPPAAAPAPAALAPVPVPVRAPVRSTPLRVTAVRASARGALLLRVTVPGAGRLSASARTRRFATGSAGVKVDRGGEAVLTVPSTAAARRRLARTKDRQVTVTVTYVSAAGARERLAITVRLPAPGGKAVWRVPRGRALG